VYHATEPAPSDPAPPDPAPPDPAWQASTAIVPLVPHQPSPEQAPLPVPAQSATWAGAQGTWVGPGATRPAQPAGRPGRRGWWIVLSVVLAAVVVAGAALAVVALTGRPAPPDAGTASSTPQPSAPRDVKLRDDGVAVTLTWTDPTSGTVPFLIAEGRVGDQLRALQPLPAGQTAYTLNGLNPTLDYCFAVVATYNTNVVATSDPVCTDRRHEPGPSGSGGPVPSPSR
jgi:hypothetical protein